MLKEIASDIENRMNKAVEILKKDYATLRAGRATPALLEKIQVDYYGTPTPINQLANISVPEARLLIIQPWDKTVVPMMEKAILKSDLGITPTGDGNVIRIVVPQLTEERRRELVKVVKKKAEEAKVAIRNLRREANDRIKAAEKKAEVSEDDAKRAQEEIQKTTDRYIENIDKAAESKEKEIMEV